METEIRAHVPGDIPRMTEIWNHIVRTGRYFPQEDELDPDSAKEFFGSQDRCGVVVVDGRVEGLYILHPNNVGRCGHICNASYCVAAGMDNKGLGGMLVDDSLRQAAAMGYRVMQFNAVVQDNASAIHLYERKGFRRIGTVPGGFRDADGEYRTVVLFYHEL